MATSKEFLYGNEDKHVSHIAYAIAHAARVKILKQLKLKGSSCVQVIAVDHPISKESLSGHLKVLREAQLVDWVERFPYTFYSLNEKNMNLAQEYIVKFFGEFAW